MPRTRMPRPAGPTGQMATTKSPSTKRHLFGLAIKQAEPATAVIEPIEAVADYSAKSRHFSDRKFKDAPISTASKAGIQHEFMSDVQAATLDLALSGKDLLVQAKTGTGKTIAFLLPAIERLLKEKAPIRGISILVLAPTRELALQIESEAKTLLKHHPLYTVSHAIGGTNVTKSLSTLLTKPPTILIATPGRLLDHLQSPVPEQFASTSPITVVSQFSELKTIVYDEADRLLDQGFKKELDAILSFLPDKTKVPRQAMLFSATVSKEIKEVAGKALQKDYKFVSTLLADEVNTHEHVSQSYIITPFSSALPTALHILRQDLLEHIPVASSKPAKSLAPTHISISKTIIFFPTARHVSFATELLSALPGLPPIFEIHSRKSQPARIKAAEGFKNAKCGVLVSSDVAARGMDFPGVTLVLQIGLPSDSDQYIHRLGRTARAGASGRGILILSPAEQFFLSNPTIRTLPIHPHPTLTPSTSVPASSITETLHPYVHEVANVLRDEGKVKVETKANAYRAWLGYYNGALRGLGWSKERLVQEAWGYVVGSLGWRGGEAPELEARTVGKMSLRGIPGLNIVRAAAGRGGQGGNGEQGRRGGRPGPRQ